MKNINTGIAALVSSGQAARARLPRYAVIDRWLPRAMIWLTFVVIAANRR